MLPRTGAAGKRYAASDDADHYDIIDMRELWTRNRIAGEAAPMAGSRGVRGLPSEAC